MGFSNNFQENWKLSKPDILFRSDSFVYFSLRALQTITPAKIPWKSLHVSDVRLKCFLYKYNSLHIPLSMFQSQDQ